MIFILVVLNLKVVHIWFDYFNQLAFYNFALACTLWTPEPVYTPYSVVLIQLILFKVECLFIYDNLIFIVLQCYNIIFINVFVNLNNIKIQHPGYLI